MPTEKKGLTDSSRKEIPHLRKSSAAESTLDHVEIASASGMPEDERLFWETLGATKQALMSATVQNLFLVEQLRNAKESKYYKAAGLTWDEVCDRLNLTVDTADRMIADHREFGALFFKLKGIVKISREAYRQLGPVEAEDGKVRIGDETFAMNKNNAQAIQAALQIQQQKLEAQQNKIGNTEQALKAAREERDNAKKAAIEAGKKLRAALYRRCALLLDVGAAPAQDVLRGEDRALPPADDRAGRPSHAEE